MTLPQSHADTESPVPERPGSRLDRLLPRSVTGRAPDLRHLLRPDGSPIEGLVPTGGAFATGGAWLATVADRLGAPDEPEFFPRRDPVLALVQRITQGFQREELERARALGYEAYLEEQLDPPAIDDGAMDARLAASPTLFMSPIDLLETYASGFTDPFLQLKNAPIQRAVHSKRQLFERMCEFWNDHFSINQNKEIEWALLPDFDRNVIRPGALGTFPELLGAVAHSGAMLFYLDNWLNVRGAPQENYARELLELHSLGLRGGYDEADVKEVAKCFTGWTLGPNLRPDFDRWKHESSHKFVLGQEIPNLPPRGDAQAVIELVGAHPSTARFIATKLLKWFLTPEPQPALVERVAAVYLATGGDIKAMLRLVLARENFGAVGPIRPKFRRPFHFAVALLRALGANVTNATYPLLFLYTMGHVPFDHVQPDGYPDTVEAWGTSLLARWRYASELLQSATVGGQPWPGVALPRSGIVARVGFAGVGDTVNLAQRINRHLLGSTLSAGEERLLQEFIDGSSGPFNVNALLEAIALGASLPGYQWY